MEPLSSATHSPGSRRSRHSPGHFSGTLPHSKCVICTRPSAGHRAYGHFRRDPGACLCGGLGKKPAVTASGTGVPGCGECGQVRKPVRGGWGTAASQAKAEAPEATWPHHTTLQPAPSPTRPRVTRQPPRHCRSTVLWDPIWDSLTGAWVGPKSVPSMTSLHSGPPPAVSHTCAALRHLMGPRSCPRFE